jgi:hypothetical protein
MSHGVWKLVELQSQLRQLRQKAGVNDMGLALETANVYSFDDDPSQEKLPQKLSDLQSALLAFGAIVDAFQDRVDSDLKGLTQFLDDDESQIEAIAIRNGQLSESLKKSEAALASQQSDFLTTINDLRKQAVPDSKPLSDLSAAIADLRSFLVSRKK